MFPIFLPDGQTIDADNSEDCQQIYNEMMVTKDDLAEEKRQIEEELELKLREYNKLLEVIEPWESTGLESDIDSLQRVLARYGE